MIEIGWEAWDRFWPEADALVATHFGEVAGDLEPHRPYKLDSDVLKQACDIGLMKIMTARADGRLVGYLTWNVHLDPESAGLLVAYQGGWYVADEPGLAKLGLGLKLYRRSVEELKKLGVKYAFPHHRNRGRGAKLGMLFRRLGAVEVQTGYSLYLGT